MAYMLHLPSQIDVRVPDQMATHRNACLLMPLFEWLESDYWWHTCYTCPLRSMWEYLIKWPLTGTPAYSCHSLSDWRVTTDGIHVTPALSDRCESTWSNGHSQERLPTHATLWVTGEWLLMAYNMLHLPSQIHGRVPNQVITHSNTCLFIPPLYSWRIIAYVTLLHLPPQTNVRCRNWSPTGRNTSQFR